MKPNSANIKNIVCIIKPKDVGQPLIAVSVNLLVNLYICGEDIMKKISAE